MGSWQNKILQREAIFVKDSIGIGFLGCATLKISLGRIIVQIGSKALISSGRIPVTPVVFQHNSLHLGSHVHFFLPRIFSPQVTVEPSSAYGRQEAHPLDD